MTEPIESWRSAGVVRWLLDEGLAVDNPRRFLQALCEKLVAEGLPLVRFASYVTTLHPQIFGYGYIWERGKGARYLSVDHAYVNSEEFRRSPIQAAAESGERRRWRLADADTELDYPMLVELRDSGATDHLVWPYRFADGTTNFFTITGDGANGFSDDDIALLGDVVRLLARYSEARSLHQLAIGLLDTYVGHSAGERILKGQILRGSGETIRAALWFCDLRGFTALSDRLPRDTLIALLNDYFDRMGAPVYDNGGEILKFIGDAMLAIFPLGDDDDTGAACQAAVRAARQALAEMDRLNREREGDGLPALGVGIGLHIGDVMYGNIGTAKRLDFTVIGPAVNLADRLQSLCPGLDRRLIASREVAVAAPDGLVSLGRHNLRGIDAPLEVFGLEEEG